MTVHVNIHFMYSMTPKLHSRPVYWPVKKYVYAMILFELNRQLPWNYDCTLKPLELQRAQRL